MGWKDTIQEEDPNEPASPEKVVGEWTPTEKTGGWRETMLKEQESPGMIGAASIGGLQGATGFLGDEALASGMAIYDALKDEGSESFDDKVAKHYQTRRKQARAKRDEAFEEHPLVYGAGFGGGMLLGGYPLTQIKATRNAGVLGKSAIGAAGGAISGIGHNESDFTKGDFAPALHEGGMGALLGGAIPPAASSAMWGVRRTAPFVKGAFEGFNKTADFGLPGRALSGLKTGAKFAQTAGDFKRLVKNSKREAIEKIIKESPKPQAEVINAVNVLKGMSDDEYMSYALLNGDEQVIDWISKTAATQGTNINAEQLKQFLKLPVEERARLRNYDTIQGAKNLVPVTKDAQKVIKEQAGSRFRELQDEAKDQFGSLFSPEDVGEVANSIKIAGNAAKELGGQGGHARRALATSNKIMEEGSPTGSFGLSPGALVEQAPEELFMRLQRARESIDDGLRASDIGTREWKLLKDERLKIDQILKSLDSKKEADRIYSIAKSIEENIFEQAEFGDKIDPYKLNRLLGNTDSAKRFQDNLGAMKEFSVNAPDELSRGVAKKFIEHWENAFKEHSLHQGITKLNFAGGPSSRAIEKALSSQSQKSMIGEAVKNPIQYMQQAENMFSRIRSDIDVGPWANLSDKEKRAVAKLMDWLKNEGGVVTPERLKTQYYLIIKNIK